MRLNVGRLAGIALLLLGSVLALANAPAGAAQEEPSAGFALELEAMRKAYAQVEHYTATFLLQERIDRQLGPEQRLLLKFKKPLRIYLRWLQGTHEGRQALYPAGVDGNELWVRLPLPIGSFTVSLDPQSLRARKGSRHAITEVGIGRLLDFISENASRAMQHSELTVEAHNPHFTFERPSRRYVLHFPPDSAKGYYCMTARIDVDVALQLPVYAEMFDWQGQLIERYGYSDIHLNQGLTDADFDPKNPAYGF